MALASDGGQTPGGLAFVAARAHARVRLHRAEVAVVSQPGVAPDQAGAVRQALDDLAERVFLVLSR